MALPADSSLAFFLTMDEASGTRLDISGNNRHALHTTYTTASGDTAAAGTLHDAPGIIGRAAAFTVGSNQCLKVPHDAGIDLRLDSTWSLSAWVFISADDINIGFFTKDVGCLSLQLGATKKTIRLFTQDGNVTVSGMQTGWNHIVCGRDGTANEVWLRLNGGAKNAIATTNDAYSSNATPFYIGKKVSFNTDTSKIDQVRFAMYRFSDDECASLAAEASNPAPVPELALSIISDSKFASGTGIPDMMADHLRYWNLQGGAREVVVYGHGVPGSFPQTWEPQSFGGIGDGRLEEYMAELMATTVTEGGMRAVFVTLGTNAWSLAQETAMGRVLDFIAAQGAKIILGYSTSSRNPATDALQVQANAWYVAYAAAHPESVIGLETNAYDYFVAMDDLMDDIHPTNAPGSGSKALAYMATKAIMDAIYGDGPPTIGGGNSSAFSGAFLSL